MENKPLVNFLQKFILDLIGVFSMSSLLRNSMRSAFISLLFVKKLVSGFSLLSRLKRIFYSLLACARS